MWLAEVKAKAGRRNQILFTGDSLLLAELRELVASANRRELILWALELAEETVCELESRYPGDCRPREAVEARVRDHEQLLRLWTEREQTDCRDWADFLIY